MPNLCGLPLEMPEKKNGGPDLQGTHVYDYRELKSKKAPDSIIWGLFKLRQSQGNNL